jgi:hypothetical protein
MSITRREALDLAQSALSRAFSLPNNELESPRFSGELDTYVMWLIKADSIEPGTEGDKQLFRQHLANAVEHVSL